MIDLEQQNLEIRRAIAAKVELAGIYCFPTNIAFTGVSDFWAQVEPSKNTQKLIETTSIVACRIEFTSFEDLADSPNDDPAEMDSPIVKELYELTLFRSKSSKRLDESDTPGNFEKRVLDTDIKMQTAIKALCREFRGVQVLDALSEDVYSVRETNSLSQDGNVQKDVECEFIAKAVGNQVKLICSVKIQLRSC